MDDFKKLTEQLLKIYINADSANDLGIENYFDENISLIGTGKHELYRNLHEFLESFKFDVKRRGKIRIEVRNLHQEEERLDDDHVLAYGTVDFVGLFKDGSSCFEMETRFTVIYKRTNGKWLVQHLHQSAPDLEQMDGEEFPLTLGKQVKKTRQALQGLGTAYYHISRLNLKTKKVELVKRSRKMDLDIKDNIADWDPQFKIIESIIAEPFVQKYIDTILQADPQIDTLVLACTHYPLLRSVIDRFIPEGITVIQQGEIVARSLKDYLRRHPEMERELSRGGQIEFLTTEKGGMFDKMAALFMQAEVTSRHIEL